MPFPRFTRGRSGGLSFETMNEIFDRIEALEVGSVPSARDRYRVPPFLGRLLSQDPTGPGWSFEEVTWSADLSPGTWAKVTGGRTSSDGRNDYAFPAVGSVMSSGSVVMLVPMNRDSSTIAGSPPDVRNGKLVFSAIPLAAGSSGRVARVMSSLAAGLGNWRYTMKDATVSVSPTGVSWNYSASSPSFEAYNGAEAPADASGSYGVGMVPPTTPAPQMNRKPIKNGTVVPCTLDANGKWIFSIPNGYEVIC